jgi:hypothetical protein
MAGPAWLCLDGYLRCISYSQSPPTVHYTATVDSIFKRSFWHCSLFRSLSFFHSFSHTHTHRHTHTHACTHIQARDLIVLCQHLSSSQIVSRLHPLPPTVYCEHGSYDPTSIARHNQSPSECSQTTYRYQSNNKGECDGSSHVRNNHCLRLAPKPQTVPRAVTKGSYQGQFVYIESHSSPFLPFLLSLA